MAPRPRFLDTCRAIAVLCLAGASTAYAALISLARHLDEFDAHNTSSGIGRRRLFAALGIGAGVALLTSAVYWLRRKDRGAERLARASRILSPFVLGAPLFPVLRSDDQMDLLARVAAMAIFVVALEPLLRVSLAELATASGSVVVRFREATRWMLARVERKGAWGVAVLVAGYALYMSYFTILNHRHFTTSAFDLGCYDSAFYNALHGHPFRSPPGIPDGGDWSMLRVHAEFAMYALLPFYAVCPRAETLLVLQSCALASGAVPIYRMAARRISRGAGLVLAAAYLLYAPMHGANFYDVHFQTFAAAAVLWAIDALDARHTKRFVALFVLALSCREDIPLLFLGVAGYLVFARVRPGLGILLGLASLLYFVVVKFVVMTSFGSWWFGDMYKDLYPPGDPTLAGVLRTIVLNPLYTLQTLVKPEKVVYLLQILTPLAFLPLRRKLVWLSLVPAAFLTLLTTGYPATIQIRFQYSCYFIALIFPAAVLALETLRDRAPAARPAALLAVLAGTLLTTAAWGAIPPREQGFPAGYRTVDMHPVKEGEREKERDLAALAAEVPRDARLAVTEQELPHIRDHLNLTTLKWGFEGAEYILAPEGAWTSDQADAALFSGAFVQVDKRGIVKLLKRR
jgi:uncharacterized membrane protein